MEITSLRAFLKHTNRAEANQGLERKSNGERCVSFKMENPILEEESLLGWPWSGPREGGQWEELPRRAG